MSERPHMSSTSWRRSQPVTSGFGAGWVLVIFGVLAFLLPPGGTAQQPPDPVPPVGVAPAAVEAENDQELQTIFRSEISFVRVDAIVTDEDGNALVDLTADDFEIFEDDIPQKIESFKLVKHTGVFDPDLPPPGTIRNEFDLEREAAREDSRIFVFFLDEYHVRDYNAMRMMQPLVDFVETQLAPTDLVGIMYPLTPLFDVTLTRNHEQIVHALRQFQGRKYEYDVLNSYEAAYAHYPTTDVEKIRNDVSLSALKALAMKLGGLREGRKSIIVLSEGYTDYVPPQLRDESAGGGGRRGAMRYNPLAGNSRMEESTRLFQDMGMRANLVYTADIANRNNTSFYMVDPRGLAVWEYDMSQVPIDHETDQSMLRILQDTLYVLADESDGRAIVNRNDIGPGLAQIVADQSSYYLLGYTSSEAPTDGEFHEIKVEVNRPDVRIRARKGYYALTEDNATRLMAPPKPEPPSAVSRALAKLAEPTRSRLVRTWVGASRGDNGKTRLTFVWEPIASGQSRRDESASQVMLMAMSDNAAYFRGEVPSRPGGTLPLAEFEADPGELELNVAIEDEYGDVLDRAVDELVVPDFTGTDVALSTPTVLRAQNTMEMRRIAADPDALPTAGRYFRRTDQLLLRGEAYAPGASPVDVTARLLNREGASMMPLPVELSAGGAYELSVQLSPFPRGDYLVEVSAASGDGVATALVAFRIQG